MLKLASVLCVTNVMHVNIIMVTTIIVHADVKDRKGREIVDNGEYQQS